MKNFLPAAFSSFRKIQLIFLLSLLFFLLIPNFILRTVISCSWVFSAFSCVKTIGKKQVFLILLTFYCLAYVYCPYWNVIEDNLLKVLGFTGLFGFGMFWAFNSSSAVEFNFRLNKRIPLVILILMIYLINYHPLGADIPWRGDEDYHITSVIVISEYADFLLGALLHLIMNNCHIAILIISFLIIISVYILRSKAGFYLKTLLLSAVSLIPLFLTISAYDKLFEPVVGVALRYPFIERWFSMFFIYPAMYSDISLYRMLPFLSVVFLSWFLFYKFNEKLESLWMSMLLSLAFVTVPLVYFYSNLLYLEMPVVLLMTICVFDLEFLILSPVENLFKKPGWYCLLFISFLKETVFMFLFIIVMARFIYQIIKNKDAEIRTLIREIKTGFLVLSPLAIYLFFRMFFSHFRPYGMALSNLGMFHNYFSFIKALSVQFGILFFISAGGFIILVRKNKLTAAVISALVLGNSLFFIADGVHVGFARWNLFILPVIFFLAYHFISCAHKYFRAGLLLTMFVSNIFLLPIHPDGVHLSNWASSVTDTGECVYPYEQAVKWLSKQKNVKRLLVLGQDYPYHGFTFYFSKYNFTPKLIEKPFESKCLNQEEELFLLKTFFDKYARLSRFIKIEDHLYVSDIDTILYPTVNNISLNDSLVYGEAFKIVKKISNSQHSLYIFTKIE